jgi:hypothetical protein
MIKMLMAKIRDIITRGVTDVIAFLWLWIDSLNC